MFFNIVGSSKRSSKQMVKSIDPRTQEGLWDVPVANEIDLNDAVAAARGAFPSWKSVPIEERQDCLLKLAEETEKRKDEICYFLARECGKSDLLAAMEIDDSLKFIRFNASQSLPDEIQYEDSELKIISSHHPLGIVAAICPWNFPLVLAVAKIAAALVTGNCIIVKPSPFSPYATLKFVEIAMSVVPPGVLQALNGDNDFGRLMTLHPGIDKISFTGSTATGKKVAESASKSLKRLTLELGGNDASIIFPDVNVQNVASKVASGCFFHSGQMCVATKRVYIHRDIFSEFRQAFVDAVRAIAVDTPREFPSTFGPIQNKMQFDIVKGLISDCREKGYKLIYDGGSATDKEEPGFYIRPVVVDRPPDNSKIVQEEQFGPIIPLCEWTSEDEVIKRVNAADSGLSACVWSADVSLAQRLARNLEVGTVWINSFPIPNPYGYFSGWKQSGVGGEWGKQGLLSYCHTQTVQLYKRQVAQETKRA